MHDLTYEVHELGRKLAATFGVEHCSVEIYSTNEPEQGFYTASARWFATDGYRDCILSFKIESDEVIKVSLHLISS